MSKLKYQGRQKTICISKQWTERIHFQFLKTLTENDTLTIPKTKELILVKDVFHNLYNKNNTIPLFIKIRRYGMIANETKCCRWLAAISLHRAINNEQNPYCITSYKVSTNEKCKTRKTRKINDLIFFGIKFYNSKALWFKNDKNRMCVSDLLN